MPDVFYGSRRIVYQFLPKEGLKTHYITVDKSNGVILKGSPVSMQKANQLILKKARWILGKLAVVKSVEKNTVVTGSRLPYLGRSYYVEVVVDISVKQVSIEFNQSKFKITINNKSVPQSDIDTAINEFYQTKAIEKIPSRVTRLSYEFNLSFKKLQLRRMSKRWGSCTQDNKIILNIEAIKLPFTLIDYLIVHELCHTKVKDHSKAFWAELSKHVANWKTLDEKILTIKL